MVQIKTKQIGPLAPLPPPFSSLLPRYSGCASPELQRFRWDAKTSRPPRGGSRVAGDRVAGDGVAGDGVTDDRVAGDGVVRPAAAKMPRRRKGGDAGVGGVALCDVGFGDAVSEICT